jgi:hypothetical protein
VFTRDELDLLFARALRSKSKVHLKQSSKQSRVGDDGLEDGEEEEDDDDDDDGLGDGEEEDDDDEDGDDDGETLPAPLHHAL